MATLSTENRGDERDGAQTNTFGGKFVMVLSKASIILAIIFCPTYLRVAARFGRIAWLWFLPEGFGDFRSDMGTTFPVIISSIVMYVGNQVFLKNSSLYVFFFFCSCQIWLGKSKEMACRHHHVPADITGSMMGCSIIRYLSLRVLSLTLFCSLGCDQTAT